jgi:hypothetical protein
MQLFDIQSHLPASPFEQNRFVRFNEAAVTKLSAQCSMHDDDVDDDDDDALM